MFIHIGTVDIPLTTRKGDFFCPVCREQTEFVQKKKKRFLAVYFIPVIPIQDVEEYVKCRGCRQQFGTEIPDLMRNEQAAAEIEADTVNDHILRMMVLVMIADGFVDERELATIRECFVRLSGHQLSDDDLRSMAAWADVSFEGVGQYARRHVDELSLDDKREAVRAMFLVATACGDLPEPQEAELTKLPEALNMDEEMFRNIIEEASLERI